MSRPREYQLYDNNFWTSYHTLNAACWDLCVKLYNLKRLDLLFNGTFEETIHPFSGKKYYKRYSIELLFPYSKFTIKKTTKGDLNREELYETLDRVYKLFNERIKNKD